MINAENIRENFKNAALLSMRNRGVVYKSWAEFKDFLKAEKKRLNQGRRRDEPQWVANWFQLIPGLQGCLAWEVDRALNTLLQAQVDNAAPPSDESRQMAPEGRVENAHGNSEASAPASVLAVGATARPSSDGFAAPASTPFGSVAASAFAAARSDTSVAGTPVAASMSYGSFGPNTPIAWQPASVSGHFGAGPPVAPASMSYGSFGPNTPTRYPASASGHFGAAPPVAPAPTPLGSFVPASPFFGSPPGAFAAVGTPVAPPSELLANMNLQHDNRSTSLLSGMSGWSGRSGSLAAKTNSDLKEGFSTAKDMLQPGTFLILSV